MLIDCICGESKFAINAEQIGFDGRLVKCGKCGKEWFQESKLNVIEKKLIDLDQTLHSKEIKIANEKNFFSDKISSLERELETKSKEIENQKILEQRLNLFESRVRNSNSEISKQKSHDQRINALQQQLEKKTLDLFIKNTALEKRTIEIQELVKEKSLSDRLSNMEKEILEKEERDNFINTTRPVEVFDGTNIKKTSIPSSKESAKSFEVDEITVVKKDINGKSEDAHDHIHEDEDESARIGRAGDPFKRKKI